MNLQIIYLISSFFSVSFVALYCSLLLCCIRFLRLLEGCDKKHLEFLSGFNSSRQVFWTIFTAGVTFDVFVTSQSRVISLWIVARS